MHEEKKKKEKDVRLDPALLKPTDILPDFFKNRRR